MYFTYAEENRTFRQHRHVGAGHRERDGTRGAGGSSHRVAVSGGLLETLGVAASLGRWFSDDDDETGRGADASCSRYDYWQRRFGGDQIVDRPHDHDQRAARGDRRRDAARFRFVDTAADVIVPMRFDRSTLAARRRSTSSGDRAVEARRHDRPG